MADHAHSLDHAAEAHAGEHHPHVLPLKVYFSVWGALVFGTILTVAASFVHIGPFNIPIMLFIAVTKATLVALFFMHLLYDEKFNLLVFLFGLIFVGLFFTFTLADSLTRGTVNPIEKHMILPEVERGAVRKPFSPEIQTGFTSGTLTAAAATTATATAAAPTSATAAQTAPTPAAAQTPPAPH